jgi:hypothetical protein
MIKRVGFTVFLVYSLNFAAGYYAVRSHREDSKCACERILAEARGWALLGVLALMPGEANACLDIGVLPRTRPDVQRSNQDGS